jgi:hypothetical protein
MAFDQINIKDCLCDMYDIRRTVKQAKLFDAPKDNDGTIFTVGDCIDNVIEQLSEELKRRGQEI